MSTWMTTEQAAKIVGVTPQKVAEYCRGGGFQKLDCRRASFQGRASRRGPWQVNPVDAQRLADEFKQRGGVPGRDMNGGDWRKR